MRKSIAFTAASVLLGVGGFGLTQSAHADESPTPDKVWVCKYVATPGKDEVIKEGKNPIHVAASTIKGKIEVGATFTDEHGRSVVVSLDEAQPDTNICEDFLNPPADPSEEPTDPSEEPTEDPSTEPTDDPTDPADDPTEDPTDPAEEPTSEPTDDPKDDDEGDDDSDRGVPADTGGNGDLAALAVIGSVGAAATGGVLVASRRKK